MTCPVTEIFYPLLAYIGNSGRSFRTACAASEAPKLALDMQAFENCLNGAKAEKVKADIAEASRFGVNSTPTFFIGKLTKDGQFKALRRISGAQPYAVFEKELKAILGNG